MRTTVKTSNIISLSIFNIYYINLYLCLKMLSEFLNLWVPYKILWNNDLSERRDLSTVSLLDSEAYLQKHHELLERLKVKPDTYEFGSCVLVSVGE